MSGRRKLQCLAAAVGSAAILGCMTEGSEKSSDAAIDATGSIEVLADGSTGLVGEISALALSESGMLFVTDRITSAVHVFDTLGRHVRTIGKKGQGPGEFLGPRGLAIVDSSIVVIDEGNARLQTLSAEGRPLASRPLPPAPQGGHWSIRSDGLIARPTLGLDSALAKVSDSEGGGEIRIGTPAGTPSQEVNPRAVKRDLVEGRIPDIFLNTARPVLGAGSIVWLILPARAVVEAYNAAGVRTDSVLLTEPEYDVVRAEVMAANAALPGFKMRPPEFIYDGQCDGRSLWALTATGSQGAAHLLRIQLDSGVVQTLTLPAVVGARKFALDLKRGWAYFGTEDLTALVRTRLNAGG